MTTRAYIYPVTGIERVTDGDTYWLHLDVGFRQSQLTPIRLYGADCPERNAKDPAEREAASWATRLAEEWLRSGPGELWVETHKDPDSFGRWLGHLWRECPDGSQCSLVDLMVSAALATVWPTRWRSVYL